MGNRPSNIPSNRLKANAIRKLPQPTHPQRKSQTLSQKPTNGAKTQKRDRSSKGGWIVHILAIVLLLMGASCVAASSWIATQLILNPRSVSWINHLAPGWIPNTINEKKPPKTLDELRKEIEQQGFIPGTEIALGRNASQLDNREKATDLLLPVLAQRINCSTDCERIVELRLYQSVPVFQRNATKAAHFQQINQLAIAGPEEFLVMAPLINNSSDNQASSRALPVTSLKRFEGKVPSTGVWLNLSGSLQRGGNTVTYGQILHYNPKRWHLSLMLDWSSPTGKNPIWKELTGGGQPELIVDCTVGLEPHFKLYRLKPRHFVPNPIQLEPVSLLEPAIDSPAYNKALLLARSGLWSIGLEWLQSLRQSGSKQWTQAAQTQMNLIEQHAKVTQVQAEQSWANSSQQVMANLVDGRWARAMTIFEASPENSREIAAMLQTDSGQIRSRIETILRINPTNQEAKLWGALLVASQQGDKAAIAWLKKQPPIPPAIATRAKALIKQLN